MSSIATNLRYPSETHCFQLNKFEGQKDWRLWDISVSSSGNIAVSGHHWQNGRTFIDLYCGSEFSCTNKPKVIYSREFRKFSENYRRCVSLFEKDVDKLVTSVGDKIEVIDFKRQRVTRSRNVKETIRCLIVSEEQIITALDSNKVNIYDKSLSKISSLIMEELPGIDQPDDMIVAAGKLYLCTQTNGKALSLRMNNGNILTDFSPTKAEEPKACSVTVSFQLHLLAVLWNQTQIAFYPLNGSKSVLVTNLNHDVTKIRISDTGILVTGNERTGEVKTYELIDSFFTYENMKTVWMTLLQKEDCQMLIKFFTILRDQSYSILQSDNSSEALLTALEEKGVFHHFNVNRMIEAFRSLRKGGTSYLLAELYQKKQDIATKRVHVFSNDSSDYSTSDAEPEYCRRVHVFSNDSSDYSTSDAEPEYCRRIFGKGDRMVTEDMNTGEVQIHDTEDLSTYDNLKKKLGSQLKKQECIRLADFFSLSKQVTKMIKKSDHPAEILLHALEGNGVLQEFNVDRLTEAFRKLEMQSYSQVTEFYQNTRIYDEPMSNLVESLELMNDQPEVKPAEKPESSSNTTQTTWTGHKASDGRTYYVDSVTEQATWENPESLQSKSKSPQAKQDIYFNLSQKAAEFLQESSIEGEFAKFSVKVSEKLSRVDCVKLATYFDFPGSRIALIRTDFETPGLTLFDIMKKLNIINIHNVMRLKEALEEIQHKDISDTLVIPYQRKIDRMRFEQGYLSQS